jgi:hypothetical protein
VYQTKLDNYTLEEYMATESKYQVVNGVSYKKEAASEVIKTLEEARLNGTRIVITYGCTLTGKAWKSSSPLTGYVGISHLKLPILLLSKKGSGGECIKDASVLSIKESVGGKALYTWAMDESLIVEEVLETPILSKDGYDFCAMIHGQAGEPEGMTGTE